ncbi:YcjF family protein [Magnetospirillum molischianum]|uniref:GTPase domain-containing protein n=1 Tax=Magnetospirillum molischianum DSM 120 TaxID=1150626 RepID=H8FV47_MAGML|nr:DUF697 domain-containing protein [Magnetospirillum molischianum]CCG42235.1 membrane hypothetical protein [Magnetospirillum molischianum DSM 120]
MTSEAKAKTRAAVSDEPAEDKDTSATEVDRHSQRADTIIRNNVYWSMGAGVIPFRFIDTAALIAVQFKLLKDLGDLYGVPFKANAVKSSVTALLAGIGTTAISGSVLSSGAIYGLLRHAPIFGTVFSLATQPAFAAAFTYAVGKTFKRHFASGGTFLSFNANEAKKEFAADFAEAKDKGLDAASTAAA